MTPESPSDHAAGFAAPDPVESARILAAREDMEHVGGRPPAPPLGQLAGKRLLVVLGFSLSLGAQQLAAGSEDDPVRQGKRTVPDMRQAVEAVEKIDHDRRIEPSREHARQRAEIDALSADLGDLRAERDRLRAEISSLTKRIPDRPPLTPMEQRYSAVGERIPSLTTANGRQLRDAVIVKVTDAGIEVRHSTGTARIRCDQLPADWWTRFGWSAGGQQELLAAEQHQAERLEQQVAAKMKIVADLENQRRQEEQAARLRVKESVERALANATTHRSTSTLQQPPRLIGRPYRDRYPYYSNTYYVRSYANHRWSLPSRRRYSTPVYRNRVSRCSGLIAPAIAPVR